MDKRKSNFRAKNRTFRTLNIRLKIKRIEFNKNEWNIHGNFIITKQLWKTGKSNINIKIIIKLKIIIKKE